MSKMVKVWISLPDRMYKYIKSVCEDRKITISEYVCDLIEAEMKLKERFPFLKLAGALHLGSNASDNDAIDKAICDEIEGKLQ